MNLDYLFSKVSVKALFLLKPILLMLVSLNVYALPKSITIFEYHQFPPMVVSKEKGIGLSYGFARYLTAKSKGEYSFKVKTLSMQALQDHLIGEQTAMVVFVSPVWFDDVGMKKYLWTDVVLTLKDQLVSKKDKPFSFQEAGSFKGKVIGGIKGYTYPVFDSMVSQRQAIRLDFNSDLESLKALKSNGNLDAVIVNEGPLKFYSQILGIEQDIFIASQPLGVYPVRVLLTKDLPSVHKFLQNTLSDMEKDDAWLNLKALYLP